MLNLKYAAGFVDGEGCITSIKTKQGGFSIRIFVGNTNENIIRQFKSLFKFGWFGHHQRKQYYPNAQDVYRWEACYRQAEVAIKKLLPYLIVKKEQAKIAIKISKLSTSLKYIHGNRRLPIINKINKLHRKLSLLKRG